jgi:hypothetical protein
LEIVGDGTAAYNKIDATSRGVLLGSAELGTAVEVIGCVIEQCSIVNHYRGIHARLIGALKFRNNNVGSCWKTGIKFEEYAGSDGHFIGNNINSCYWENDPVDVINDDSGVGVDIGYGCAVQSWIGGKIEWNSVGILLRPGAFALSFSSIMFDANSRHHVHIVGHSDTEDIWTEGHQFRNNVFGGGSYKPNTVSQNLDCHVLIECPKSAGASHPTQVSFSGNQFKATDANAITGVRVYWPRHLNDGNYPRGATIRVIETGVAANSGFPILDLIGNDFRHSSIKSGTVVISGTTVTRVTGDPFEASFSGLPIWFFWYDEYAITNVVDANTLTINEPGPTGTFDYRVETNRVVIASTLNDYMTIRSAGNVGINDFTKVGRADRRDLHVFYRSNDSTLNPDTAIYRLKESGDLTIRGIMRAKAGMSVDGDQGGLLSLGRLDSGGSSVIDAYDTNGGIQPTALSLRVNSNEKLKLIAEGTLVGAIGIGTNPNATYVLDVNGYARVSQHLNLPSFPAKLRFAYVDNDGFVVPQRVNLQDPNHMHVTGMTPGRAVFVGPLGDIYESKRIPLNDPVAVNLAGAVGDIVVTQGDGSLSIITKANFVSSLLADGAFIAGVRGITEHTHDEQAPPADTGGPSSGASHTHPVVGSTVQTSTPNY